MRGLLIAALLALPAEHATAYDRGSDASVIAQIIVIREACKEVDVTVRFAAFMRESAVAQEEIVSEIPRQRIRWTAKGDDACSEGMALYGRAGLKVEGLLCWCKQADD